jgi:hypothetical protein
MKISENNYSKIKLAFERFFELYHERYNLQSINRLSKGDFFAIHSKLAISICNDIHNKDWFVNGNFLFNNYELYPNNCNDNHLDTLYKRLIKETYTL